jgi:hypothetical protein
MVLARRFPVRNLTWFCVALAVAGCTLPSGLRDPGAKPPTRPAATTKPTGLIPPKVNAAQARQKGIVNAIQNTLVAGDLARSQNAVQLISDNGLGLISDNGLGLISDNGLGLIANNGGSYRLAQAKPEIYYEDDSIRGGMVWASTFYKPDYRGEVFAYDVEAYKAKGKAAASTEHYTWDALGIDLKNPSLAMTMPLEAELTYKLTPVKSARFTFVKRMNLKFAMTIKQIDPPPAKVVHNGFSGTYDMEVPLADGTKEVIAMTAYDMVYDAGKGPGSDVFYVPRTFKAKGANERGKLDMSVDRFGGDNETDALRLAIGATHVAKDGRQSKLKLDIGADNLQHSVVTDVDNAVEAVLDIKADRTGSGQVRAVGSEDVLGTIAWKPDGLGTITFTDGTVEKVRIF